MPPCHRSIPTCARCGEVLSLREREACLRVLSAAIATDWPQAIRRLCHACVEGFLRNIGDFSAIPAARRRLSRQVASMKNKAAALAAQATAFQEAYRPARREVVQQVMVQGTPWRLLR